MKQEKMAWLQTKRACLSRRQCLVILLLSGIIILFRQYSKQITKEGKKQLGQNQMPEYSQNMQQVGENRNGSHFLDNIFQGLQVHLPWKMHHMNQKKDQVIGTRSKSTHGKTGVHPLYDFIRYPCLENLPLLLANTSFTNGNCVRTVNFSVIENISTENCVPLKTPTGSTPICTYPPEEDIPISRDVHKQGHWERGMTTQLARLLESQTGLELLDIGCNIGVYTLSIAHQGTHVTAIDPVVENIQLLSKSVKLGNLDNKVRLIWNALSNEHKAVTLKTFKHKVGLTEIKDVDPSAIKNANLTLTTIMLDDLLPIFKGKRVALKMDIEKSEYNALLGGKTFFSEVDIPIIQMEIAHNKKTTGPMIIKYLSSYRFQPFRDIDGKFLLNSSYLSRWPHDVYFIKDSGA